jgi:hypothetical protein
MSTIIDPLKETTPELHRFWIKINSTNQWYQIIHEAQQWFHKNWRCQPKVKRRLQASTSKAGIYVWFDVPDPRWATWVATKMAVQITIRAPNGVDK